MVNGKEFIKQCVMPPHDILSTLYATKPEIFYSIFVGEPGRIEKYWDENTDLYESLQLPNVEARLLYCLKVLYVQTGFEKAWFLIPNGLNVFLLAPIL